MSTQALSHFTPWPNSNLYLLPISSDPITPLTLILNTAFEETLNFILSNETNANLKETLQNAFNQSFGNTIYNLVQVQEWIQNFILDKKILEHDHGIQITLAFNCLIYEMYIKDTYPIS